MKKVIIILLSVLTVLIADAQEKGKIRVGFNGALAIPQAGLGFTGDWDIRYNISNRVNAGIMFNGSLQTKDLISNGGITSQLTLNGSTGILAHGDYYFNKPGSVFATFIGGGIGTIKVGNIQIASFEQSGEGFGRFAVSAENTSQGLIRGGFEAGHFRMTLNYYIIPESALYDLVNMTVGSTRNSYVSLSIGFYLGGGRWSRSVSRLP